MNKRLLDLRNDNYYIAVGSNIIMLSMSLIVLFVLVVMRRRRDLYMILTPLFIGFASLSSLIGICMILKIANDREMFLKWRLTINVLFTVNNFFAMMSY